MAIEEWYKSLPIVTRTYVTMAFLTTAGCALEIITPFNVYFNAKLVFKKLQLWRLVTNFFFFGNLGLDFVFHMFFLIKYCKSLEEGSFRGRSADFLWMLIFGGSLLTCIAPFVNIQFLGSSLTFMMVYVWGRRHQYVNLSFLGIFNFTAPYLPWVLLAFSLMLGSSPVVDLMGMAAGHVYYFLEDVYPRISGRRPLKTPALIKMLFPQEDMVTAPAVVPPPERQDAFEAPAAAPGQAAAGAEGAEADGRARHQHAD
ncbi:hypothetical protein PLESTB_000786800 [Pleodorina starrii]|uniref:Derlin n=1 Tax=Pleodorina starrii TaxID=330485 RepID=A0A9W6BKH8_9CHLO|nr:hypothetical protein PLESTM_000498000 [Pleodorina starrii]GLC53784.1 hypothetical protein PLESTB_000786800 [Pleodorina starrii]GLC72964.1 hypothetical protein PLESTF_001314500 [Pleodorina starrii]